MSPLNINERSEVIELIVSINQFIDKLTLTVQHVGGESTLSTGGSNLFPDMIFFGDKQRETVIHGWEVKMPDTDITDSELIQNAEKKANALGVNSFFLWNYRQGVLYLRGDDEKFHAEKQWDDLFTLITTREDVKIYESQWNILINKIILELDEYFSSGAIQSELVSNALTTTLISSLINNNKLNVATSLENSSIGDARLDSFLNKWWRLVKGEYTFDESSKFTAYAKNILLNWINRIIFAHLLKPYHQPARRIDSINEGSTVVEAIDCFKSITQECDFLHIFSPVDYCELIPQSSWSQLLQLHLFLLENSFGDLQDNIFQSVLEQTVRTSKREIRGQFSTPKVLADLLTRLAIRNWRGNVIDPCCGTGTILKSTLEKKITTLGIDSAYETTWGADKFSFPLQIANIALSNPNAMALPLLIFQNNAFELEAGNRIEVVDPESGELLRFTLPQFDFLVSNLPFIAFTDIDEVDLEFSRTLISELRRQEGIRLDNRSDIFSYLLLSFKELLNENGRIGIITSNSWLGTKWGTTFRQALMRLYSIKQVLISGNGRWFQNADVVTTILILENQQTCDNEDNHISFCITKKRLSYFEQNSDDFDEMVDELILDESDDTENVEITRYTLRQVNQLDTYNLSWTSYFSDVLWLEEIGEKLIPITQELKVIRGERRGWDALFYPSPNEGIEDAYLRQVVKSSQNITTLIAQPDGLAFCCEKSLEELRSLNHQGALNWINRFTNALNNKGKPLPEVLTRRNMQWYEMKDSSRADFITSVNPEKKLFFAKLSPACFINQRLIGMRIINEHRNPELLHALLNSIVGMFFIEAIGFGRGLGALDLNSTKVKNSFLLNPNLLSQSQIESILSKFRFVVDRPVLPTVEELFSADRVEFDQSVFECFGISFLYERVRNSLLKMQEIRLAAKN